MKVNSSLKILTLGVSNSSFSQKEANNTDIVKALSDIYFDTFAKNYLQGTRYVSASKN